MVTCLGGSTIGSTKQSLDGLGGCALARSSDKPPVPLFKSSVFNDLTCDGGRGVELYDLPCTCLSKTPVMRMP